jgi:flagellar biosynthesis protein FlhG
MTVRCDLADVVDGEKPMAEVLLKVASGVRVLPMAVATGRFARMDGSQKRALETELGTLDAPPEVLLADTSLDHPLGFSPLSLAAHHTVVVMAPTPASITEAYALIKKASFCHARRDYRVLVNGTRGPEDGRLVFANVARVTHGRRFARLEYAGCVPLDERLPRAAALGQPAVGLYPDSPAARACRALAGELMDWPLPEGECGGLEQFVRHLLHSCQQMDPVAIYA